MKPLQLMALTSCLAGLLPQAQASAFELRHLLPGLLVTASSQDATKLQPTLGAWGPFAGTVGDNPLALTPPSSDSSGAWTFQSSDPAVALVQGNMLSWLSAGSATLTATQAATATHASASRTASLLSNAPPAETAPAAATGYWSLRFDFAGSSYSSVPAPSVTSLGYSDTCSGVVATGSSAHVWAATASLGNLSNWPGQSRTLCVPAAAADVKAFSSLTTYSSENGWFKYNGRAMAIQAGGQKWVVAGLLSTDTAGVYPSWNSRRIFAILVPSFTGQQSVLVDRKSGADVARGLNYPVP